MSILEAFLLTSAGVLYLAAWLLVGKDLLKYGFLGLVAGLSMHLAGVSVRWVAVGHPPVFGTFEATLAASWFLLLFVALSFGSAHRHFRLAVLSCVPLALLLLLYGVALFDTRRIPLTISERSWWIDFHALFSWLAFAPFTLAFCLSAFYLWETRRSRADATAIAFDKHASKPARSQRHSAAQQFGIIDELAFRYISFGFVAHSVMFALGSYYSSIIFGTWWRWDPVFSISLMAWLLVGLYIHMRIFYNWGGGRAARLYVGIFAVIIVSYWGLIYLPAGQTFHVFDLAPGTHVQR